METNGQNIECIALEVNELYTNGGHCDLSCNRDILSSNKGVK